MTLKPIVGYQIAAKVRIVSCLAKRKTNYLTFRHKKLLAVERGADMRRLRYNTKGVDMRSS